MCETKTKVLVLRYGQNKIIPKKYEEQIITALSHYPELQNTHINFELVGHASVPYGTKPSFASCFMSKEKRVYTISLLEKADPPEKEALMNNLDSNMQIGVIGHELMHVVQYEKCNCVQLFKTMAGFAFSKYRHKLESGADKGAIKHGLGLELLAHARYIRSIPGYVEKRPNLNRDYLLPHQIEFYLNNPDKLDID